VNPIWATGAQEESITSAKFLKCCYTPGLCEPHLCHSPTPPSWHHTLVSSEVLPCKFLHRCTEKFSKHSQIPYYQGILKLFLIFLYDHPELRNAFEMPKKLSATYFYAVFYFQTQQIVFSAFKTGFLSSGWPYRIIKNSF
jgi:hypothetical protein